MRVYRKAQAVIFVAFLVFLIALPSVTASRQDAPTILSRNPLENEPDVKVDKEIRITFSKAMSKEETEAAFKITPNVKGQLTWEGNEVLKFEHPNEAFKPKKDYVVTITASAKSLDGINFSGSSWEFTTEEKQDDWWKTWEPVVTIATVIGTAAAAGFGYYKIRKKRGQLRKYMIKIDTTYDEHRKDPQVCENRLNSLKEWLKVKVKQGMVDEYHYLILDKKIDDYLQDIRFRKSLPKPKVIKGVEKDIQTELEKKMKEQEQEKEKEKPKDKPEKPKEHKKPPRPKIIAD